MYFDILKKNYNTNINWRFTLQLIITNCLYNYNGLFVLDSDFGKILSIDQQFVINCL